MSQKNSKDHLQNATKATEEKHPLFTGGLGWSLVCVCVSFSRIPPSLRRALTFAMVAMVTSTHFMPAPHTADIFVWLV